jgi:hypothetical protein
MRILIFAGLLMTLSPLTFAQTAPPARLAPAEAKNHAGEVATVCGKVVDTKVFKYGIGGRGKPVNFDLDQPEPNPVFYFVAFGKQPDGPDEAVAAYKGKQVCVTGKISAGPSGAYIMAADRSQVKEDAAAK